MARKTTIYFVSDLHGSSLCFRKFVNAAPVYGASVLILGADLAGKAIQPIVRQPGNRWASAFPGREQTVEDGPESSRWKRRSPTTATTRTGPSRASWKPCSPAARSTRCSCG